MAAYDYTYLYAIARGERCSSFASGGSGTEKVMSVEAAQDDREKTFA